jgi:DNA-directed RNA polymerase subunit RPC12/RpoP
MGKPKFYQAVLQPIEGNVLAHVYPRHKGQMTMTERMGSEEAKCLECGKNEWWLLPTESASPREGGKPYIECLNCGSQTHL